MFLSILGYYRVPRSSYRDCQICMMTSDYLKQITEYENVESNKISDDMNNLCELFDISYIRQCRNIVNNEFERIDSFDSYKNTTQQFCYSLGYCKKPGPGKRKIKYRETINDFLKSAKKLSSEFLEALQNL